MLLRLKNKSCLHTRIKSWILIIHIKLFKAYPIIPKWIIQIDENPLLLQAWNRRLLAIHYASNPPSKYVTKLSVFALVRENHYTPTKSDVWAKGQGIVPLKNF